MTALAVVAESAAEVSDAFARGGFEPRQNRDGYGVARCPVCGKRDAVELRALAHGRGTSLGCATGCDLSGSVATLDLSELHGGATSATPTPQAVVTSHSLAACAIQLSADGIRATPPQRRYVLWTADGEGILAQGKVSLLGAKGGTGKSFAVMQLAVAGATGGLWFGDGGWQAAPGRVLLLLAEEEAEEAQRRLHWAVAAAGLSDELVQRVAANVTILPLAGRGVAVTVEDPDAARAGVLPETAIAGELRGILKAAAAEGRPFTIAVLDPLSRFAGGDVEKDNAAATRFVQVLETFTAVDCGEPTVLVSHHLRKQGKDEAVNMADLFRGASGLVDGVRWAAVLSSLKRTDGTPGLLRLEVPKTNYAKTPPPLMLCRPDDGHGTLRAATEEEIEDQKRNGDASTSKRSATTDRDLGRKILGALAEHPDTGSALARRLHVGKTGVLQRCSDLAEGGLIERERLNAPWTLTATGRAALLGSGGSGTGSGTDGSTGSGGSRPPLGAEPEPEPLPMPMPADPPREVADA